jgi:hypothetical protein
MVGIPRVHWFFHIPCYLGMVMQLLGPSVEAKLRSVTSLPKQQLAFSDVLMLGIHMVRSIAMIPDTIPTTPFTRSTPLSTYIIPVWFIATSSQGTSSPRPRTQRAELASSLTLALRCLIIPRKRQVLRRGSAVSQPLLR